MTEESNKKFDSKDLSAYFDTFIAKISQERNEIFNLIKDTTASISEKDDDSQESKSGGDKMSSDAQTIGVDSR